MMCSSDQEFFSDGFCYGVVDGEDDDACDDIFIPGSHPVYIKTESIQVRRQSLMCSRYFPL